MPGTSSIHDFLRDAHVPYVVMPHRPAFTAQEEAAVTHVSGRGWAKTVVCFADGEPVEAVLPATLTVNLDRLRELARASTSDSPASRNWISCFLAAKPARCRRLGRFTDTTSSWTLPSPLRMTSCSTLARTPKRFGCAGPTSWPPCVRLSGDLPDPPGQSRGISAVIPRVA